MTPPSMNRRSSRFVVRGVHGDMQSEFAAAARVTKSSWKQATVGSVLGLFAAGPSASPRVMAFLGP